MKFLSIIAAVIAVAAVAYGIVPGQSTDTDLRRIDCTDMTVFAPRRGSSADDICRSYGGLARTDAAPTSDGLVILVRNQPMGGFDGQSTLR